MCGRRGCLTAEAGLESVLARAGLDNTIEHDGITRAQYLIKERVARGDPAVLAALAQAGAALSSAILDLAILLDPTYVVLGGYWSEVFDALQISLDESPRLVHHLIGDSELEPGLASFVRPGRLGRSAARRGAIHSVVDELIDNPARLTE